MATRYAMLSMPVRFWTSAISPRDSDACVCTSSPRSAASTATASRSRREHETANLGANATRMRPSWVSCQRSNSVRASPIDVLVFSFSRAGASAASSIMHLPIVARRPERAISSKTTSVSCTVSIVRIDVVPPRSSSQAARRADARSEASVCAASSGQTRVRSQSIRLRSSASPRNRVWHRWTCVCTKPGSSRSPAASITRSCAPSGTWPSAAILPSRTERSPCATSIRSFMVTSVALRNRTDMKSGASGASGAQGAARCGST